MNKAIRQETNQSINSSGLVSHPDNLSVSRQNKAEGIIVLLTLFVTLPLCRLYLTLQYATSLLTTLRALFSCSFTPAKEIFSVWLVCLHRRSANNFRVRFSKLGFSTGARGALFVESTAPQDERFRVRFPVGSLEIWK